MANQQLADYFKQNKDKYPIEKLKQASISAGYSQADVEEAAQIASQSQPVLAPPAAAIAETASTPAAKQTPAAKVKKRSPFGVLVLMIITFGIYALVWWFKTSKEVKELSEIDFSSWGIFIPIYNLFVLYKYFSGIEKISEGKTSTILLFLLWVIIAPVAIIIIQSELNKHATYHL